MTSGAYELKELARSAVGGELSQIVTTEIEVPQGIIIQPELIDGYVETKADHPYRAWLHDRLINQLYTERAPAMPCDRIMSPRTYRSSVSQIVRTAVGRAVEELPEVDVYRGFFLRLFDAHTPNDDPAQLLLPLSYTSMQEPLFSVA